MPNHWQVHTDSLNRNVPVPWNVLGVDVLVVIVGAGSDQIGTVFDPVLNAVDVELCKTALAVPDLESKLQKCSLHQKLQPTSEAVQPTGSLT